MFIYIYIYIYYKICAGSTGGPAPSALGGPRLIYMAINKLNVRTYMAIYVYIQTKMCIFDVWACILGV